MYKINLKDFLLWQSKKPLNCLLTVNWHNSDYVTKVFAGMQKKKKNILAVSRQSAPCKILNHILPTDTVDGYTSVMLAKRLQQAHS